ncbi:hypothetical protein D3C76_1162520 [compost metagenome]
MNHLLDGHVDEARGVVGHRILDALGEELRKLRQAFLDQRRGLDGVGPGRQLHCCYHCRFTIQARRQVVVLAADGHARDITQAYAGTVRVGTQDDSGERFRGFQGTLHGQGRGQFLFAGARRAAEAASRYLNVLTTDGIADVVDGKAVAHKFLRVDPDAHGRFGGKELQLAHTGHAQQFVIDVTRRIV